MKTSLHPRPVIALTAAALCLSIPSAHAALRNWSGSGADSLWSNSANWGTATIGAGDDLQFRGVNRLSNQNDLTAGTIFKSLIFHSTSGEFILDGNAIGLTGAITQSSVNHQTILFDLLLNGASHQVNTSAGDLTLRGVISGGAGNALSKVGQQTLTLTGENTFTGAITVSSGQLTLDARGKSAPILGGANALTLSDTATLRVIGRGDATNLTQALGVLTPGSGQQTVRIENPAGSGETNVVFSSLASRTRGNGFLYFDLGAQTSVAFQTAPPKGSAALAGGANHTAYGHIVIKDTGGVGFAGVPADGARLARVATTVLAADSDQSSGNFFTETASYSDGTFTLDNTAHRLNTLNVDTSGGEGTLDLNGSALTFNTGGGLLVSGGQHYTIRNGSIATVNTAGADLNFAIMEDSEATLDVRLNVGNQTMVKSGLGQLNLARPAEISSGGSDFNIHAGKVHLLHADALKGEGTSIYSQVRLAYGAAITFGQIEDQSFTIGNLAGAGSLHLEDTVEGSAVNLTLTASRTNTISGSISGSGSLRFTGSGVYILTGINSYSGGTLIESGELRVNGGTLGTSEVTMTGGILSLMNSGQGGNVNETLLRRLSGSGGIVSVSGADRTLIIDNTGDDRFGGVLQDLSGATPRLLSLIKRGSGTQRLDGENTFSGSSRVEEGRLLVNGSLLSTGSVAVAEGAALGGEGSAGHTTFAAGSIIAPGEAVGALNLSSATFQGSAIYEWDVSGLSSGAWDQLTVTGVADFSAVSEADPITLMLQSLGADGQAGEIAGWDASRSFVWEGILTADDLVGFDDAAFVIDATGFFSSDPLGSFLIEREGNRLDLRYVAPIPEPSSLVLIGVGVLIAVGRRLKG